MGVLWQGAPLLWIHPKISPAKTLVHYPTSVAQLALLGIQQCIQYFGVPPKDLIIPYNGKQLEVLSASIDDWAILRCSFQGAFDNHYPKDPILQLLAAHPVIFPHITSKSPLLNAPHIFTDGSKMGQGAYLVAGSSPVIIQSPPALPQVIELQIVIRVFELFPGPFNLISDSQHVVNMLLCLEVVGKVNLKSTIGHLGVALRDLILQRSSRFFVQHIRTHTGLPGPLAEGNDIVDKATRACMTFFIASPVTLARDFHSHFHVNSKTLSSRFKISRAEARDIVKMCQKCAPLLPQIGVGFNPPGLLPLHLWQMDGCYPFSRIWKIEIPSCFHRYRLELFLLPYIQDKRRTRDRTLL